jgi:hypothetical protein
MTSVKQHIVMVQTLVMFGRARSSRAAFTRWHSALCDGQAATAQALPQKRTLRQPVQYLSNTSDSGLPHSSHTVPGGCLGPRPASRSINAVLKGWQC